MTWEAVSAIAAVLGLLIVIVRQLRELNRNQVEKAKSEAKEKAAMESRVQRLEADMKDIGTTLTEHIKHTNRSLDALRLETPSAIAREIVRAMRDSKEL